MLRCAVPRATRQVSVRSLQTVERNTFQSPSIRRPVSRFAVASLNTARRSYLPASGFRSILFTSQQSRSFASNADDFPPHVALEMPALSPTMTKGNLVKWLKQNGDQVSVGDAIAEMETDKATVSWDSMDDGYFVKGFVEDGTEDIPVGQVVALLAEDKDDCDKFDNYEAPSGSSDGEEAKPEKKEKKEKKEEKEPAAEEPPKTQKIDLSGGKTEKKPKTPEKKSTPRASGGRVIASPAARRLAEENDIDLEQVEGTGPNGRIVLADVENFEGESGSSSEKKASTTSASVSSSPSTIDAEYEDIPNSKIRKVIAQRLTESKQTIPHYYLTVEFCVDKLQQVRKELNDRGQGKYKLSVNDFIIKASAMTMRSVPEVNSTWNEKAIRRYHSVNINVAVNSDIGLFTPLVPNTDNKGLVDISSAVRELAGKAKDGKLTPDELQIGTFTISNLGMFGIKQFAAVINPPQACILAVGGIEARVVTDGKGGFKESHFMSCTLSCDHRVVDGALGATWLKEFKTRMEDPLALLL